MTRGLDGLASVVRAGEAGDEEPLDFVAGDLSEQAFVSEEGMGRGLVEALDEVAAV